MQAAEEIDAEAKPVKSQIIPRQPRDISGQSQSNSTPSKSTRPEDLDIEELLTQPQNQEPILKEIDLDNIQIDIFDIEIDAEL
jgi:hypothetical protein